MRMEGHARTWFTPKQKAELWERWKSGQCVADIAQELHRRHQRAGLFLRSTQSLAARQQREHQRLAATVFPEGNRSLALLSGAPEQDRAAAQSTPAERPWASKHLPIDYEQCCSDQLNPHPRADIRPMPAFMSTRPTARPKINLLKSRRAARAG